MLTFLYGPSDAKQRKLDAKQPKGETTKVRNNEIAKGRDGPIRTP